MREPVVPLFVEFRMAVCPISLRLLSNVRYFQRRVCIYVTFQKDLYEAIKAFRHGSAKIFV